MATKKPKLTKLQLEQLKDCMKSMPDGIRLVGGQKSERKGYIDTPLFAPLVPEQQNLFK